MSITGLTGQKLGPYVLQGIVAHGARSVVYEARNRFLDGLFAVKLIHPDVLSKIDDRGAALFVDEAPGPDALARCRRDSDLAAALRHPSIVRILEWSRDGALPLVYLISEHVSGEDVQARIRRRGRLSAGQVRELGLRVSMALAAVHKLGVAHRGLTPRNLQFTLGPKGEEIIKIRDFGLAHLPLRPGAIHDVAPYLAPEIAAAVAAGTIGEEGGDDTRADQFSLAAVLFEALTGQAPPAYDEIGMVSTPPPLPLRTLCPDLPPFLVHAIERALSPIPNERFATMEDFTRALDNRAPGLRLSGNPLPPGFSRASLRQSLSGSPPSGSFSLSASSAGSISGASAGSSGPLSLPSSSSGSTGRLRLPPLYSSMEAVVSSGSPIELGELGELGELELERSGGREITGPRLRAPVAPIAGVTLELEAVDILEGASGPQPARAPAPSAPSSSSSREGRGRPAARPAAAAAVPRMTARPPADEPGQASRSLPGADPALWASGRLSPLTLTPTGEEMAAQDVASAARRLSGGAPSASTSRVARDPLQQSIGGRPSSRSPVPGGDALTRSTRGAPSSPGGDALTRSTRGLGVSESVSRSQASLHAGRGEAPSAASAASLSQAAGQRASAASRASQTRRARRRGNTGAVLAALSLIVLTVGGLYLITTARMRQRIHESDVAVGGDEGAAVEAPRPAAPPPPAPLDPQLQLDQAEQALSRGDLRQAIDQARQALPSLRAWRIIAVAACRGDDAQLMRQALEPLSELERRDVQNACRR